MSSADITVISREIDGANSRGKIFSLLRCIEDQYQIEVGEKQDKELSWALFLVKMPADRALEIVKILAKAATDAQKTEIIRVLAKKDVQTYKEHIRQILYLSPTALMDGFETRDDDDMRRPLSFMCSIAKAWTEESNLSTWQSLTKKEQDAVLDKLIHQDAVLFDDAKSAAIDLVGSQRVQQMIDTEQESLLNSLRINMVAKGSTNVG